jgi:hypothetical protein
MTPEHGGIILDFDILPQPDDETCGPTCLHAVYNYYGQNFPLKDIIRDVKKLKMGGTLAVMLGNHALAKGYKASIYTFNLHVFDPSWFGYQPEDMVVFLKQQIKYKPGKKLQAASEAYIQFLESGGIIKYQDLNEGLIKHYLRKNIPLLTGLSATHLYGTPRELPETNAYDSIRGVPSGHFVVINGFDKSTNKVYVTDPLSTNPLSKTRKYSVHYDRLISAILLGIVTYDANILIIEPHTSHG